MSRGFESIDWYETPLYYDIVFAGDEAKEASFLEAMLRSHGPARRGRRVRALEPACGSGRLVLELARRGFDVTGFDASDAMLGFARARLRTAGKRARLMSARMESFDAGRGFELAHCLVNTFKYLLDERNVQTHLSAVARALVPGGLYVIGLHLTDHADRRRNRERWVGRRGRTRVVCNIQGWPPDRGTRIERVRSRLRVTEAGVERRAETEWLFRTYDWPQFRRTLHTSRQFELVATYDFGYDLKRPRTLPDDQLDTVFVLRRI